MAEVGSRERVATLLRRSRRLLADLALLVVLDARRAALQLAQVLSAVLVAAVLLVTTWLACVVAFVGWLIGSDAGWPLALAAGALINLVAAAGVALWLRALFSALPFAALLRQLRGEPSTSAPEEVHP